MFLCTWVGGNGWVGGWRQGLPTLQSEAGGGVTVRPPLFCLQVGAHFFPNSAEDPWNTVHYHSSADGTAIVRTVLHTVGLTQVLGHALVVHLADAAQTRIGCGVIQSVTTGVCVAQPGPPPVGAVAGGGREGLCVRRQSSGAGEGPCPQLVHQPTHTHHGP